MLWIPQVFLQLLGVQEMFLPVKDMNVGPIGTHFKVFNYCHIADLGEPNALKALQVAH